MSTERKELMNEVYDSGLVTTGVIGTSMVAK